MLDALISDLQWLNKDGNGVCSVAKVWTWRNQFECPEGSIDSYYSSVPTNATVAKDCLYGVHQIDGSCKCWNSNDPTQPGYCLDSTGACGVAKIFIDGRSSCPTNSTASKPSDPIYLGPDGCAYGTKVNNQCQCSHENNSAEPGFCKDAGGRCTVVKEWQASSEHYACPLVATKILETPTKPPRKVSCPNKEPADGCGAEGKWLGCACDCTNEGRSDIDGFCKDQAGRCTIKKSFDSRSKTYLCIANADAVTAAASSYVMSGFWIFLVGLFYATLL